MKRKAFTLVEIVGAIAIIGIAFVVIIRFMGNRNLFIDKTHEDLEGYLNIGVNLSEAEIEDDEINGNLDIADAASSGIVASLQKTQIFGKEVEYELFYIDEETSVDNVINDYTYNFKDVLLAEEVPSTDLSIFPIEPDYIVDSEPLDGYTDNPKYNPTNPNSEKYVPVYGLYSRTNSNYTPLLEYDHVEYLKSTQNFVTMEDTNEYIPNNNGIDMTADTKRNRVTQKLIDDGIAQLASQDTSKDYQVLFLERKYTRMPVLFPTTGKIIFDLTPLSKNGEDVNFVFITNSQIGSWYQAGAGNKPANNIKYAQIEIKGGNVYFISMYDVPYITASFRVNGNIDYYGTKDYTPQFTYAMARAYEGQEVGTDWTFPISISGDASFFIYTPSSYIEMHGDMLNRGPDGVFQGAIVAKNAKKVDTASLSVSSIPSSVTGGTDLSTGETGFRREEWKGTAELLGFKNYLGNE